MEKVYNVMLTLVAAILWVRL